MNDFLDSNYEVPASGQNYMKLKDGENKFRILSKPIVGWIDWKDKVPHRFIMTAKPEKPFDTLKPIKHFWAFIVFDYADKAVKILEITQATIQTAIKNLSSDQEWGAPFAYDLKITRKGQEKLTEYAVVPSPKKDLTDDMKKAALDKPCNLEALYSGSDPWVITEKQTELAFSNLPF
jgi:hypothetical protein